MDRNIKIEIKDRIAHLVGTPKIICGNNDYSVTFTFDDEWTGIDVKTLRVSYNNKYSDHVFTGGTVELPPIYKAVEVYLGVFAGDITSTKVAVRAEPSILCAGGSVADPEPDVYAQIIDLLNSREPSSGSGGITQETDPTVPAWAKEPNKPSYTAEEIGAQPKGDYALRSEIPEIPEIPEPYTLPTASPTVKGGVMIGEGLQMDGEKVRVKPEGVYELISLIEINEPVAGVDINDILLKEVLITVYIPASESNNVFAATVHTESNNSIYFSIPNAQAESGARYSKIHCDVAKGLMRLQTILPASKVQNSSSAGVMGFTLAGGYINSIRSYMGSSKDFPVGSWIKIEGVRANA